MRKTSRNYWRNVAGNMSVMAAFASVPVMAAAGAGLDWMRYNDGRTELYAAMDGAVLAGTEALAKRRQRGRSLAEANRFLKSPSTGSAFLFPM